MGTNQYQNKALPLKKRKQNNKKMSTNIKFRLAAYTDPAGKWNEGAPRKGNEDDLFVDADLSNNTQGQFVADQVEILSDAGCLLAVADGMGGMNAGEVASAIAIDTVKSAFSKENLTDDVLASQKTRTKYLEKVIIDADAAIKRHARMDNACEGMGSTLILAWLYDNQVTVSWCGDSRAYLFRKEEGLCQISKDHSYVQNLVDEGKITIEEAFDHPYGNIITRSLGDPEKKAEPESVTVAVAKGDILLVCSDGLSGVLRDRKSYDMDGNLLPGMNMEDIISENCTTMVKCREALWNAAEKSEWYDNVTAILCEIVEGPESFVARTVEGMPNNHVNKSFISFVVRKKGLKVLTLIIAALCISCVAWFFGKRFIKPKSNPEVEIFIHQRDSLINVADSLGIIVLKNQLLDLDPVDLDAINTISKDIIQRNNTIQRLKELREKASVLSINGVVSGINQQIDAIRCDVNYTQDIVHLETSVSIGEQLMIEIDKALKDKARIIGLKRKRISEFKEEMSQREVICETDIEKWEQLIISDFEKSDRSINAQCIMQGNLTEVNII